MSQLKRGQNSDPFEYSTTDKNTYYFNYTSYYLFNKPVGFYCLIAPPIPNAPEVWSVTAAMPPVQSEYPTEHRAAAAMPLPESP